VLGCKDNNLTSLDISNNLKLRSLYCANNYLTNLDISNNLELNELYCANNYLTSLVDTSNYKYLAAVSYEPQKELVKVTDIKLSNSDITIENGKTAKLDTTIAPDNATFKDLIWTSDNEKVATVDEKGTVTAISVGTANVTASATDGSGTGSVCKVTVTEAIKPGDVNNDDNINISDLMAVLNYVSGKSELVEDALTAADVNGDGMVDLQDLMRLLNYVSGKVKEL
jgi:uncharacterized protein YjdB